MATTTETYGQRLRAARKAAGLTLRALAERTGCNFTYVSHIEADRQRPSVALGRRLGIALGEDLLPPGEVARLEGRLEGTQRTVDRWREAALGLEAENDRLTAALEVATRGWVRLPDFGDPHCRYCGGTGVGVANFAHDKDCPVAVYWQTQGWAGTGGEH